MHSVGGLSLLSGRGGGDEVQFDRLMWTYLTKWVMSVEEMAGAPSPFNFRGIVMIFDRAVFIRKIPLGLNGFLEALLTKHTHPLKLYGHNRSP
jgi:hypothetical protein